MVKLEMYEPLSTRGITINFKYLSLINGLVLLTLVRYFKCSFLESKIA